MVVYNFLVRAYGFTIRLAAPFKQKAAQWVKGRQYWRRQLSEKMAALPGKTLWVHCASYGEFEQGRPLMEAIKKQYPQYHLVLTFFSPSGYEAFKNWKGADVVCYLPLDTKRNARDFIDIVKPHTAIFIKYEFWVNFLFALKKNNIPTFLVSAVFKPHHPFFKWYGGIFRRSLQTFHTLFIQDTASGQLLSGIGIRNYQVSGDTRFDRVLEVKASAGPNPFFEEFCKDHSVIIAGSTWPKDETWLIEAFLKLKNTRAKLILVPHNVDAKSISSLQQLLEKYNVPYTLYSSGRAEDTPVAVVDTMGVLSRSYRYATVTYIGGGFNSGIHNCLEPAVYLKPVLFYGGTDYHKYNEAVDLVNMGAAANVRSVEELAMTIEQLFSDENKRQDIAKKIEAYFTEHANATGKILDKMNL